MDDEQIIALISQFLASSSYNNIYPVQGPQSIGLQEGLKQVAYLDNEGNWTIGLGHTPAYPGESWTLATCMSVFFNDVYAKGYQPVTTNLPWVSQLSVPRQWVNYNASFNMGFTGWSAFEETLTSMQNGNWLATIQNMKASDWYDQVPNRVMALAYQLYFDEWVIGYLTPAQQQQLVDVGF